MKLYVGNLPFTASEQDVQDLFAEAGAVETVQIMRDQATGRPRGFGFVTMVDAAGGQAAIAKLDQQPFQGRNLTVNEARPQVKREGGFGGGGGGGGKFGGGGGGRNRREPRWETNRHVSAFAAATGAVDGKPHQTYTGETREGTRASGKAQA